MAKKAYIGVSNVAKNIKKMYVGVNNVARKVKKGYIGVNNVARLFFSGIGRLVYYGSLSEPSGLIGRFDIATTCIGNYALFAGGGSLDSDRNYVYQDGVYTVNKQLTWNATGSVNLSTATADAAGAHNNTYALIAGGITYGAYSYSATYLDTVDAYNASLVRSSAPSLSVARDQLSGTDVGTYAVFGGGRKSIYYQYSNDVDMYDNLSRSWVAPLSREKRCSAAITVGNYVLFAGGIYITNSSNGYYSSTSDVDVYSTSFTKGTTLNMYRSRGEACAAHTSGHAFICGNNQSKVQSNQSSTSIYYDTDVFDSSLTQAFLYFTDYEGGTDFYAFNLEGYAVIARVSVSVDSRNAVLAFDDSLTQTIFTNYTHIVTAANSIGDYGILVGTEGTTHEVYQVV